MYATDTCHLQLHIPNQYFSFSNPILSKRISKEERKYIEDSICELQNTTVLPTNTPWKGMFTSRVVWSVALAHLASNWGVYQMNTLLPTYLHDVLQ